MSYFLYLETSSDICSVALSKGQELLSEKQTERDFSHSEHITIFIEQCLEENEIKLKDVSCISISAGPGSYTGLRIAASVAKAICYAQEIPLIAIDSLSALAFSVKPLHQNNVIIPIVDARNLNVYTAAFNARHEKIQEIEFKAMTHNFVPFESSDVIFVGSAISKLKSTTWYEKSTYNENKEKASNLILPTMLKYANKDFQNAKIFSPFYLNNPNITTPKKLFF